MATKTEPLRCQRCTMPHCDENPVTPEDGLCAQCYVADLDESKRRHGSGPIKPAATGLLLPDETYVNEHGGKQSKVAYRMDLTMWRAVLHLAHISKYGAEKYGEWNWHKITANEHLNHALIHIAAHQCGDTTEDHAGHAAWRVLAWLDTMLRTGSSNAINSLPATAPPTPSQNSAPSM